MNILLKVLNFILAIRTTTCVITYQLSLNEFQKLNRKKMFFRTIRVNFTHAIYYTIKFMSDQIQSFNNTLFYEG